MTLKTKATKINKILSEKYPTPVSALIWHTPWQMLVAALLSAQTTDVMVNKVTNVLFSRYPNVEDIAKLDEEKLYEIIRPINYSRNKTKFIKYDADFLLKEYDGVVPNDLDELIKFKGIGRKVANVVLGDVFRDPVGIVVDTHVKRVSKRLGLTENTDPVKIERDLMKLLPKSEWVNISHRLIFHGREICIARKPKCEICPVRELCDYYHEMLGSALIEGFKNTENGMSEKEAEEWWDKNRDKLRRGIGK
jgi:endonuclease-3